MMLDIYDRLPNGLLELDSDQLWQILPNPTLIHLEGDRQPPLFVSILLHGNETTSWLAMRELLRKYRNDDRKLPRSLSLFIGNVEAARYRQRHLDHQPDYNRIWQGNATPEQRIAQQVIAEMRSRNVFASIDIHNNTGRNPHYGCITRLDRDSLQLARLFDPLVVYYTNPKTVQSYAFGQFCPAIVLECGQPDQPDGTAHALSYVETCLNLSSFAELPDSAIADVKLFHTVAIVKVPPDLNFAFACDSTPQAIDLLLPSEMDRLNFTELAAGHSFGKRQCHQGRLIAINEDGEDQSDRFFEISNDEIILKTPVMPSMISLNPEIVRQDCLCYLMEQMPLP
ncbi:MAG: M14 family metallopeptidase [Pseudanabaenaceae cyanobacterium bins.39]|nr:M14 family metallopeptidase [Pseudanabaenaceae cyanobacterium bins.39]